MRVKALDNAPAREIVRGKLDGHSISGKDANAVDPHPPRNMREDLMSPFRLDAKRGVGEILLHDPD